MILPNARPSSGKRQCGQTFPFFRVMSIFQWTDVGKSKFFGRGLATGLVAYAVDPLLFLLFFLPSAGFFLYKNPEDHRGPVFSRRVGVPDGPVSHVHPGKVFCSPRLRFSFSQHPHPQVLIPALSPRQRIQVFVVRKFPVFNVPPCPELY